MRLHRQIVWLTIGVAVVPVLVAGEIGRREALEVHRRASQDALAAEAAMTAELLARESAAVQRELELLAIFLPPDRLADSTVLAAVLRQAGTGPLEGLRVRDGAGGVVAESGTAASDTVRCTDSGRSVLMVREAQIQGEAYVLEGTYWIGESLDADGRRGRTVLDPDGTVLLAPACEDDGGGLLGLASAYEADGRFPMPESDGMRGAAFTPVGSPPWALAFSVAAIPSAPVAGPVRRYAFPLGLVTLSLILLGLIVRRWSATLEGLAGAARAVAAGDLSPWLPPPRRDELGDVTLAFSAMTARLRDRMEQVDRSGRLAVVGKLASYLAHEVRNPLSAVKMNLQRLDRWTRAGEIPARCAEPVRVSLGEVDRLSTAVSNVLQLSRSHDQPPREMSAHELVREAGILLDNEFANRGVALRWELDAEADRVVGRPGQLKGVILNLMLNALDAQPDGGQLIIRSNLAPDPGDGQGPRLELRFRDHGSGVSGDVRDRIFEPFFTTKADGSGIGLAVASKAVRDHGGDLSLEELPAVGSGAEFVVSLPLAPVAPESGPASAAPRLAPWLEEGPREDPKNSTDDQDQTQVPGEPELDSDD